MSIADLQTAINGVLPGDTIVVHKGICTTSASITANRPRHADEPIRIVAQTIGGVGDYSHPRSQRGGPAAHVKIRGFLLTHASGEIRYGPAPHIRFTQNFSNAAETLRT